MTNATPTPTPNPSATPINEAEFIEMIEGGLTRGTMIVSFDATTDARLRKTGNPLKMPVVKVTRINGMIGYDYENSVNNQRNREDGERDFVAEPRRWGVRKNRAFVVNKGKFYLTVKCERVLEAPEYFDAKGNLIEKDQVAPFLPKRKEGARQGVEKKVIHRDYALTSIDSITMNKQDYIILH